MSRWIARLGLLLIIVSGCHPSAPNRARPVAPTALPATPRNVEPVSEPEPIGAVRRWVYHYDRNALVDSQIVGSHALAITEAGHILQLDARSLALTGEKLCPRRAVAFGPPAGGGLLVGFADGQIFSLDADTLAVAPVAAVPGEPVWIGFVRSKRQTIVVYGNREPAAYGWAPRPIKNHTIRVLETGEQIAVDSEPTAFFVDSRDRLWIGADHGEWGGSVQVLDFGSSPLAIKPVNAPEHFAGVYRFDGVYGFTEIAGEVWAFGGTSHMGFANAFVAGVHPDKPPVRLFPHDDLASSRKKRTPNQPRGPISHVVRIPGSDRVLVFSFGRIFETNVRASTWKRVGDLDVTSVPGRPDAVGNYPAVKQIHVVENRLLMATARDGFVEREGNSTIRRTLPNQLAVRPRFLLAWKGMILAFGWNEDAMILRDGTWQLGERLFDPPIGAPGRKSPRGVPIGWASRRIFPAADGSLFVVAKEGEIFPRSTWINGSEPNRMVVGVRKDLDRFEVIGDETVSFEPEAVMRLPDGQIAAIDDGSQAWRFADGRWSKATFAIPRFAGILPVMPYGSGFIIRVAYSDAQGNPQGKLVLLTPEAGQMPRLTDLEIHGPAVTEHSRLIEAAPWDAQHALLAMTSSLCVYDIVSSVCVPLPHARPSGGVALLKRDGLGTTWLAGRGLWALDSHGRAVRYDASLPFTADTEVLSLEATDRRVVIGLGVRGFAVFDSDPSNLVVGGSRGP